MRKFIVLVLSLLTAACLCGCGGGGGGTSTNSGGDNPPADFRPMGADDTIVYSTTGTLTYTIDPYEQQAVDQTNAARMTVTQIGTGTAGTRFAVALNLDFVSSVYEGSTAITHNITLLLDQNGNDIYLAGRRVDGTDTLLSSPVQYYKAGPVATGSIPTLSMAISISDSETSTETYSNLIVSKYYGNDASPYPTYMHITGSVTLTINSTEVLCYPDIYLTLSAIGYSGEFPTPDP